MYSCTIRLTAVFLRLAACLVLRYQAHILSLSGLLHVYSHSQACCHLFSHSHSGSLPIYSHSIRLAACLFSHYQANSLSILLRSLRLAAYLFSLSLRLARCLSILTLTQARCLSILTLTQALCLYPHTIRLIFYLFSHSSYCLSVFTLDALKHSCSLAHQCIRAHSRAHCLSILILATYLVPHPDI